MTSVPLRIMTRDFQLINEISLYSSLQITRSWHGIGSLELRINRYLPGANELTRGRIVFPQNKLSKAYLIKHREIELDENGKASENWIIRALPLKSWAGQRPTIPPVGLEQDSINSNAETVMQHYVNNNIINPTDPGDKMDGFVLSANLNRGINVHWQSRYKNLAEELTEISFLSGLGWNVGIDIDNKQFVFEVLEGRDLTVNQSILPPAIFSPEFGTLRQLGYVESDLNYKNTAIIAGQGEGVERRIVKIGDATGYDRYTVFFDARDISETVEETERPPHEIEADLINRGQQKLTEYEQEIFLEGQIMTPVKKFETITNSNFITQFQPVETFTRKERKGGLMYEEDYDLGDIVTLQNKEWGVTLDARITEIKEIYEPGNYRIDASFGSSRPTLIDKIKQELSQTSAELRR